MEEKETREYFERHVAQSRIEIMGAAEHLCNELALVGETIVDLLAALPDPEELRKMAGMLSNWPVQMGHVKRLCEMADRAEEAARKAKGQP